MNVERSLRLPDTEYVKQRTEKKRICLHFTAGGSAAGAINWWIREKPRVGTPYVVDVDGTIYEAFDPECWAWHLGVVGDNALEMTTIGIELANWGPLTLSNGALLTYTGKPFCKLADTGAYTFRSTAFRGQHYFAAFPQAQMRATAELVRYLCDRFSIPLTLPPADKIEAFDVAWARSATIISHQNVRKDKTDIGPAFDWSALLAGGRP